MNRWVSWLLLTSSLALMTVGAQNISWFSDAQNTNLDGSGAAMDAGFQFELGVFSNGFVPTSLNSVQWASHWVAADTTTYNAATHRFSAVFTVTGNTAPFVIGANAWILGRRLTATGDDLLLFRSSSWTWPAPDPMSPLPLEWNAKDANIVVLGAVNGSGSPFLMKSAASQTFAQWQAEQLAGEPLNGSGDDPDHDGVPNLLEFVFGTPPKTAGAPTATPVSLVDGHLQITIPRRIDHPAVLTVEVSGDLANWHSGLADTEVVSDGLTSLVVRDLTPLDAAHPKRFIRLHAALPEP
jgi:hypothetical protein